MSIIDVNFVMSNSIFIFFVSFLVVSYFTILLILTGLSAYLMLCTLQGRCAVPPNWAVTFVTKLLSNIGPSSDDRIKGR